MPRTSKTQQRYNIKLAYMHLLEMLKANFPDGACLITLDYWRDKPAPGKLRAEAQRMDWRRMAIHRLGENWPYIYATGWNEQGDGYPIHRVVSALPVASAAFVAGDWEYGDTKVETVPREGLEALAGLIMWEALEKGHVREFGKRTWCSRGLVKPEKVGKNGKTEKDHHCGKHCQDNSIHGTGAERWGAGQG